MIKKNLISIFVLAVSLIGIVALSNISNPNKENVKTLSVVLRPDGFYPKDITINKGDTVTFSTTRGTYFWPASNLHPTHTIYPEFDPKEPIDADKTWSFKFDKVGTWNYHDHLAPLYTGTVRVQEPGKNEVLGAEVDCTKDTASKYYCWEKTINTDLEKNGLSSAFDDIATFYAADPTFDCHGFAHKLGESAYKKFAKHEELTLTPKTSYCGFGFYHGFMETLLHTTGNPQEARDFCEYADKQLRAQTSDAGGACYHGIGHGAVDGSDPTAWGNPDAMIAPSLKICTTVSITDDQLYRCITGVFNAIEVLSREPKYELSGLQNDPFSLCHHQPYNYREGCYTNMLPILVGKYNIEEIAKIIEDTIKNDDDYKIRAMVILSIFHEPIRTGLSKGKTDYTDMIKLCRSIDERSHLPCIAGLSRGFMKYGEPQKEYVKALEFCRTPALIDEEIDECYRNILSILPIFYPSQKSKDICLTVKEKYQKYCRS